IPNEEGTVKFLKQLHNMEKELKNRHVQSAHQLPSEIMVRTSLFNWGIVNK
ncbi:hypothetical protein KIN20_009860, partial [Parelaphostrongylus tenuis]